VSAQPARGPAASRAVAGGIAAAQWAQIAAAAPQVMAAIGRYLQRLGVFLAPASVDAAENALRQLARWMITGAGIVAVGEIRRDDIEDDKVWLAARPRAGGRSRRRRTGSGCGPCASSPGGSSSGTGPGPRPATRSSPGTSPRNPGRCRSSPATGTPRR
jgi:hypothetical protein